jgi:hypothetical protein
MSTDCTIVVTRLRTLHTVESTGRANV